MEASDLHNPLYDMHERAGAEFQPYDQIEIVSTYGDLPAEYDAVRNRATLFDLPQRGVLELSGRDRLSFLGNLLTNQTWDKNRKAGIEAGKGVHAFFLNLKGRIVADLNVLEQGERTLLETDARLVEPLAIAFEKYRFAEQVTMTSRLGSLHEVALHGPQAAEVLAQAGADVSTLGALDSVACKLFGFDAIVWRDDPCGVPGYYVLAEPTAIRAIWTNLLVNFSESPDPDARQLRPAGWAAFNTCRIEAGRPILGVDFEGVPVATAYPARRQREEEGGDENHPGILPAETGQLPRAVSFTKGCYLGQEIVARMHARGQVARLIVGLALADDSLPVAGAQVFDDKSNQIGAVTSSTISPALAGRAICLAFVKRAAAATGATLHVPAEGAIRPAVVTALPFIPPPVSHGSTS